MSKNLGQLLLEGNLITETQLNEALAQQEIHFIRSGEKIKIGELLVRKRFVSKKQLQLFLAMQQIKPCKPIAQPMRIPTTRLSDLYSQSVQQVSGLVPKKGSIFTWRP